MAGEVGFTPTLKQPLIAAVSIFGLLPCKIERTRQDHYILDIVAVLLALRCRIHTTHTTCLEYVLYQTLYHWSIVDFMQWGKFPRGQDRKTRTFAARFQADHATIEHHILIITTKVKEMFFLSPDIKWSRTTSDCFADNVIPIGHSLLAPPVRFALTPRPSTGPF